MKKVLVLGLLVGAAFLTFVMLSAPKDSLTWRQTYLEHMQKNYSDESATRIWAGGLNEYRLLF